MEKKGIFDWFLRVLKGMIIGTGFLLPGISGGALAVIFGIYERIIEFIAHIRTNFVKNLLFFVPIIFGGLFGIVILSHPLKWGLENYRAQVLWFFIGAIMGTIPELWRKSGVKGRKPYHFAIMAATLVFGFIFLRFTDLFIGELPQNTLTWIFTGAWISLSGLIPGLPTSNFLMIFGMYEPMLDALRGINFAVLIPLFAGFGISLIPLSKGVDFLIAKKYTGFFHFVIGIVFASTMLIVPTDYAYLEKPLGTFVCVISVSAGIALGYWMCSISRK